MTNGSRLVMRQGPQPGQTIMLDQDLLTLGRDPSNDIVINHPQVSRKHARIMRQGGLVVIEDVGSTNGTFVNGARLTAPHTLANGDEIGLGDAVTFTCHGVSIAATEPLAAQPTISLEPPSHEPQPPPPPAYPVPPPPDYAVPPPPAHEPQPPPPPAYPAAPPPAYAAAPPLVAQPIEEKKSKTWLWVGCGLMVLIIACGVLAALWYAPESFWLFVRDELGIPIPTWPPF